MTLAKILQIPYFRFFSHFAIWLFVAINSFLHVQNFILQKKNIYLDQIFEQALQENQSFLDKDDYYNSELYRIKSYKEEGFQLSGEVVVNPLVKEDLYEGSNNHYIPETAVKDTNNIDKWRTCLLGGLILPKYKEKILDSPCKAF